MAGLFSLALLTLILLIFLQAALHKLFDPTEFQGFVADYRLLPERLVPAASYVLIALELGLAVLALPTATRPISIGLAIVLLSLYALAIGVNIDRGRVQIECGCGGAAQRLSVHLVWRNLALIVLAVVPLLCPFQNLSGVEIAFASAAGFFLWLTYQFFEQAGANQQVTTSAPQRMSAS